MVKLLSITRLVETCLRKGKPARPSLRPPIITKFPTHPRELQYDESKDQKFEMLSRPLKLLRVCPNRRCRSDVLKYTSKSAKIY